MLSDVERDALEDIRDNIARVSQFVEGFSLEAFLDDDRTFFAATRCLEIISEASRRLSPELKAQYPEIPWRQIAGAGNIYRHNYENVLAHRVWATIREALTPLLEAVEKLLEI